MPGNFESGARSGFLLLCLHPKREGRVRYATNEETKASKCNYRRQYLKSETHSIPHVGEEGLGEVTEERYYNGAD